MDAIFPVDLKTKRRAAGWTQSQFAERLGLAREHYGKIENGDRNIALHLALECAKIFGSLKIRQNGVTFVLRPDGSTTPEGGSDDDPNGGSQQPVLNNVHCSDEGVILAVEQELTEGIKSLRKLPGRINKFASGEDAEFAAELGEHVIEDVLCAVDLLRHRLHQRPEYTAALQAARERQRRKLVERGYRVEPDTDAA